MNHRFANFLWFPLLIVSVVGIYFDSTAQTVSTLQQKKKVIEKQIEEVNALLDVTDKSVKSNLSSVALLSKKVHLQASLITQLKLEEQSKQEDISDKQVSIEQRTERIKSLKDEYARIVRLSRRNSDKRYLIMLVLSSDDFNQSYKRIKFYNQVLQYRKVQTQRLHDEIEALERDKRSMIQRIIELKAVQKEKEIQIARLSSERERNSRLIDELNRRKKELLKDLDNKRRVSENLSVQIKRLIEEEARKLKEERSKGRAPNLSELSKNFKDNFGKLPLPVEKGVLTGVYGESPHPVLKYVKIKNNGIDISVPKRAVVYSIFEGEVRKIIQLPGAGYAIIIRHGVYLSVYSNLTSVAVSTGQLIKTYQKIGEINTEKSVEEAILHFEIWNENQTENPEKWISKTRI